MKYSKKIIRFFALNKKILRGEYIVLGGMQGLLYSLSLGPIFGLLGFIFGFIFGILIIFILKFMLRLIPEYMRMR